MVKIINRSAGQIGASPARLIVSDPFLHKTLKLGDEVVMTETPGRLENVLFRFSDATLHRLQDHSDQWILLSEKVQNE